MFNFYPEKCREKITLVAAVALCFAGNSFAQENAGGVDLSDSAFGDMNKEVIVAGALGLGILGAVVANNRGSSAPVIIVEPPIQCGPGEELIDGQCEPIPLTTTLTTTVTATNR
jgi:hypothetical protein